MANTDIRLLLSFRNHPKTKKLRRTHGEAGVLGVIYLYMFAAECKPDGQLSGMDEFDIALACDFEGEHEAFVSDLVKFGFLDLDDGVYSIHDWSENNPYAAGAKERSEKAKKAAKARWGTNNQEVTGEKDAPSINEHSGKHEEALPDAQTSNAPSPSPSPSPEPKSRGARKRGTRLPKNWQPSRELKSWALNERPGMDLQRVIDSFTDYWIAKTGQAATKLDWGATFRNWVRNEKPNGSSKQNSRPSAASRQDAAAARQAANL